MDETSFDAPRLGRAPDRDRSSRFGEVLQRAYAEDGRVLPDEITRLMLDLSRVEPPTAARPAPFLPAGERPAPAASPADGRLRRLLSRLRGRS